MARTVHSRKTKGPERFHRSGPCLNPQGGSGQNAIPRLYINNSFGRGLEPLPKLGSTQPKPHRSANLLWLFGHSLTRARFQSFPKLPKGRPVAAASWPSCGFQIDALTLAACLNKRGYSEVPEGVRDHPAAGWERLASRASQSAARGRWTSAPASLARNHGHIDILKRKHL